MFITCPVTSGHLLFFQHQVKSKLFFSQTNFSYSLRVVRPGRLYFVPVRDRLGSSSDLLKSWGGGSVAFACGARLSCSIFMVYKLLLFMALVARASI